MLVLTVQNLQLGYAVAQLIEELRYKPEGRGFDSRWCHFSLGSTQPPTELSTRSISWGVKAAGAGADNLTTFMSQLS